MKGDDMDQWTDDELRCEVARWVSGMRGAIVSNPATGPVGDPWITKASDCALQAVKDDIAANGPLNKDIDRLHKVIEEELGKDAKHGQVG